MTSPTQRTLALLRKEGWIAEVVERWIPGANIRKDLFGFIDIIAMRYVHPESAELMGVQATSDSHVSARVKKITDSPELANLWKLTGAKLEVWGWGKKGARGKVKHWECRRVAL